MLKTELAALASVVSRIRAESHPEIDETFIAAVLQAEAEAAGSDGIALQAIRKALEEALGAAAA